MKKFIMNFTQLSYFVYIVLILLYFLLTHLIESWDYTYEVEFMTPILEFFSGVIFEEITIYEIFSKYALYLLGLSIILNFITRIVVNKSRSKGATFFFGLLKILSLSVFSGLLTVFYSIVLDTNASENENEATDSQFAAIDDYNTNYQNTGYDSKYESIQSQDNDYNNDYEPRQQNNSYNTDYTSKQQSSNYNAGYSRRPYEDYDAEYENQAKNYDYNAKYNPKDNKIQQDTYNRVEPEQKSVKVNEAPKPRTYNHKVYRFSILSVCVSIFVFAVAISLLLTDNPFRKLGSFFYFLICVIFIIGIFSTCGYDNKRRCFKKSYKHTRNGMCVDEVKNIMRLYPIVAKGYDRHDNYVLEYKIQSFRQYERVRFYFVDDSLFDYDIAYCRIVQRQY